jgi:tetratricopeptide (TPR) repeat protein
MTPEALVEKLDALIRQEGVPAAENFLRQQLAALEAEDRADAFLRIMIRNELAALYRETGRWEAATEAFREVLSDLERLGGRESDQYATVLINLAGVYRLTGDFGQALVLYGEAKDILSTIGDGADIYLCASLLNNQALCLRAAGQYTEALTLLTEALAFLRVHRFSGHEIAVTLTNIAAVRIALGDDADAETALNEALALFSSMDDDDVHLAAAMSALGTLKYRAGAYPESAKAFARARDLTERFFGHNHDYEAACRNLDAVLTKWNPGEGGVR